MSNYTEIFKQLVKEKDICCIQNCNQRSTRLCKIIQKNTNSYFLVAMCYHHKSQYDKSIQSFEVDSFSDDKFYLLSSLNASNTL
jgi:hypothetical protein